MGYPVRTINLSIKSAEFRSNGSNSKINVIGMVEHDFRQYESNGKSLPGHIDPDRVKDNLILYLDKKFQKQLGISDKEINFFTSFTTFESYFNNINNIENTYNYLLDVYEKEKKHRNHMAEKYPWLKSDAPHFTGFIINFSKLAQKDIFEKIGIERMSQRVKNFCIDFFERIMGVELIYLVGHFDESAPHYHGLVTNYRKYNFQYKHFEQILNDPYFRFLTEKYFVADLIEKFARGLWRTFSGTFATSAEIVKKSPYRLPFSFLQDITHYAFKDIGFERGKSKAERLAEGEPLWKLIARDVKTLHEDLPREIELKKQELNAILDTIVILNNEKEKIEQEILEIQNKIHEEFEKLNQIKTEQQEQIKQHENFIQQLMNTKKQLKMEISDLNKEKEEITHKIKKLSQENIVYSEDEFIFLKLIQDLIKAQSTYELYEIFDKIRHNKLFKIMILADKYATMLYNIEEYEQKDIEATKQALKEYLAEKKIEIVEEIITDEDVRQFKEKAEDNEIKKTTILANILKKVNTSKA